MDSFIKAPEGVAAGIVDAYGYSHPAIIEELLLISRRGLRLKLDKEYGLNNWSNGAALKTYWPLFQREFPSLHDTITINFQSRPITGTTAEQTFSMTATQVHDNNCASTNSKNMSHAQTVKGAILREMFDFKNSHNNIKRKKLLRSGSSRNEYLNEIDRRGGEYASQISESNKTSSVREMCGKGKKIEDLKSVFVYAEEEMLANEKKGNNKASSNEIINSVKRSTYAKENNLDVIEVVKDDLVEKAKRMGKEELKDALKIYYSGNTDECKLISKAKKGDVETTGTFVNLYVSYWRKMEASNQLV